MARGRMVSRSLGSSRRYHELLRAGGKIGEFCQVIFPLLIVNADEHGRLPGDAFTVKNLVLPSSPRREADFERALQAIARVGLVHRYTVNGDTYIQISQFEVHQNLNLTKRGKSRFPSPEEDESTAPADSADAAGGPSKRREGKVSEGKVSKEKARGNTRAADALFERFWSAYPKKRAKPDALKAWDKRRPNDILLTAMLRALERQSASPDWQKESGRYIPFPATWLNQARWTDEIDLDPSDGLSDTMRHNMAASDEAERLILAADARRKAGLH